MIDNSRAFKKLSHYQKALVSFAVLVDGFEAQKYLESGEEESASLTEAAQEVTKLVTDLRLPYLGTVLRESFLALEEESVESS